MNETQILTAFVCFWLAVFGAVLGSFLDCAVSRWAAGSRDLFAGRSRCDSCGHTLGAADLVPVFSFLLRRGKCRYCGAKIPADCLWAELAGAASLACVGLRFAPALELGHGHWHIGPTLALVQWVVFAALLLALSLTDAAKRIIPDKLLLALAAGRLCCFFAVEADYAAAGLEILKACAIPAVLLALVLGLEKLWGREAMGGGDIKLLFVLALYLSWGQLLLTLLGGCLLGILWAVLARQKQGAALPFGPFLAAGALLAVCFGGPLLDWYFGLF